MAQIIRKMRVQSKLPQSQERCWPFHSIHRSFYQGSDYLEAIELQRLQQLRNLQGRKQLACLDPICNPQWLIDHGLSVQSNKLRKINQ
jgi:hypothetical protein